MVEEGPLMDQVRKTSTQAAVFALRDMHVAGPRKFHPDGDEWKKNELMPAVAVFRKAYNNVPYLGILEKSPRWSIDWMKSDYAVFEHMHTHLTSDLGSSESPASLFSTLIVNDMTSDAGSQLSSHDAKRNGTIHTSCF